MVWFEKKVRVRKVVDHASLNSKGILSIQLTGGMGMEIHSPNINKEQLPAV